MGKVSETVDESNDNVLNIDILLKFTTSLEERVEGLEVELVREHLRERGKEGGGGREREREGGRGRERGGGEKEEGRRGATWKNKVIRCIASSCTS